MYKNLLTFCSPPKPHNLSLVQFCTMKLTSALLPTLAAATLHSAASIQFDTSTASRSLQFDDFKFKVRDTFPAGPNDLFGYGLGALEQIAYDPNSSIIYGLSEQGYVSIIKFTGSGFENLNLFIDFDGSKLTDVEVCGEFLFVSFGPTI